MSEDFNQLISILGPSPWAAGRSIAEIERDWRVSLPVEFHRISAAYGDSLVDGYLFLYGPRTMREMGEWMSDYVKRGESKRIVDPVLPQPGGMLIWGHTIEGDRLFLVPSSEGKPWTVSAFRRNWGDWYETHMSLEKWLVGVFRGSIETDWLPEWPKRHTFELDGD
ncbi:hypothetical protein [Streptomyces sp. H27-S2]|uniref:hypothetical protein n=1 Tax=Streptomyces antarcticus TaxID=2996458 RepID=UPI00227092C0|nr:hypothetical protein [Streptomyces sp. H27-S2]MCY0954110.1 hypothetical protein [Streptomyces sp. H27-S2]